MGKNLLYYCIWVWMALWPKIYIQLALLKSFGKKILICVTVAFRSGSIVLTALHSIQRETVKLRLSLYYSNRQKMCIPTLQARKHSIQLASLGREHCLLTSGHLHLSSSLPALSKISQTNHLLIS